MDRPTAQPPARTGGCRWLHRAVDASPGEALPCRGIPESPRPSLTPVGVENPSHSSDDLRVECAVRGDDPGGLTEDQAVGEIERLPPVVADLPARFLHQDAPRGVIPYIFIIAGLRRQPQVDRDVTAGEGERERGGE